MISRKIRVGVSGYDLKFWYPLQSALEATGKYEFQEDIWAGHDKHDPERSKALLDWADILVAEWALGNAVYYSRHKRSHQRLIIRLHLQERGTSFPMEIDYSNVEKLVFVGAHIQRECIQKFSIPEDICTVVGNFVDVERYSLPKFSGAEYTLGIIGTAPSRKRLDLALETLEILAKRDSRYNLRVKGNSPAAVPWLWSRSSERKYYLDVYGRINSGSLRHRVIFDPQGGDVHHWLQMVGSILSPSDFESFHMAIAEGAASSAVPIVWDWEGANEIYPEFGLVSSPQQAAEQIAFSSRNSAGKRYRQQVREIIRARYDSRVILERWDSLLVGAKSAHNNGNGRLKANNEKKLIVVWAIDNWKTFHRREMLEALADELRNSHNFLVIEPGNHYETIQRLGWASSGELQKILVGEAVREKENLFRTRLFTGGIPVNHKKADYQGTPNVLKVLDGMVRALYGTRTDVLHWVYKPDQAKILGDGHKFVYEVYDDYTMDFATGVENADVTKMEKTALQRAQHTFFTSTPLYERKSGVASSASTVSNGVSFELFSRFSAVSATEAGKKTVGYLGNLAAFFDWELMERVCTRLPHVDFAFHGQVELNEADAEHGIYTRLLGLANTHFTGRVSRPVAAAALNLYDALIIPFVENEAMDAVNPLKLWEYMATGSPVISSRMRAIEDIPGVIVASGEEQWMFAIESAVGSSNSEDMAARNARIALAQKFSWKNLVADHARILRKL